MFLLFRRSRACLEKRRVGSGRESHVLLGRGLHELSEEADALLSSKEAGIYGGCAAQKVRVGGRLFLRGGSKLLAAVTSRLRRLGLVSNKEAHGGKEAPKSRCASAGGSYLLEAASSYQGPSESRLRLVSNKEAHGGKEAPKTHPLRVGGRLLSFGSCKQLSGAV